MQTGVDHSTREDYRAFLNKKAQLGAMHGFEPIFLPDYLFDFQRSLVEWAVRKGRAAILADCGTGKAIEALVWAENIIRHTNGRVLVLTPLAVGAQMLAEAGKFGIEAHRSPDGQLRGKILITNYERLHYFDPRDFAGVVADEASCIKAFDGVRRAAVTEFLRVVPYRLLCTATPSPNDYVELGTLSEALGALGYIDMLSRFFRNNKNTYAQGGGPGRWGGRSDEWTFKSHAEEPFWRWVCSWARAMRKPSDLGFEDGPFILPPLIQQETVVQARTPKAGMLFDVPAVGFHEVREVRRRTIQERCEMAAEKVARTGQPAVIWAHLNAETDLLEEMIPGAQQVSGADADESKEEKFAAFKSGQLRVLVCKPVIGAWGLNWEHCAHVVYFPDFSYEAWYQAIRRCWRFGQTRPVVVDVIRTDGDVAVLEVLQRKAEAADRMFSDLVRNMAEALSVKVDRSYTKEERIPAWLSRSR